MNPLWSAMAWLTAGRLVRMRGPRTGNALYLSFDDGPHPEHTPMLLDLLDRHGAKGSFFLMGDAAARHPQLVQRLLRGGHAIGNHTWRHPHMRRLPAAAQRAELETTDALLTRLDGRPRHPHRPPWGQVTPAALLHCLRHRQPLVLWTVDSRDHRRDAEAVVAHLSRQPLADGDLLLFHDDHACARLALQVLLPAWQRQGLCFPALP